MSTLISVNPQPVPARERPGLWHIYALEARLEFVKLLRLPAFVVPTLAFPVLFYVFFGLSMKNGGPISLATYLIATYGAFGVMGAALYGFGVGVAAERGQGWMLLKRASPMPPGAYFAAKIFMSVVFGGLIIAMLYTLGATLGNVDLPLSGWATLAVVHLAGSLPFCAMGLALGYFAGPNSAPAIVNLIYLPMGFLSGLWLPIQVLPEFIRTIAPALPSYHLAQLALKVIGADSGGSVAVHLAYLAVFTAVCLALARIGYRRDEDKTYG
jgi:ABC-2 type transport system permease protein